MNKISYSILTLIAVVAICSCARKSNYLEERAMKQLPISTPDQLTQFCLKPNVTRYEDIKTVYLNDSICLIQFSVRFVDELNNKYVKDFRYAYALDIISSYIAGEARYAEGFLNTLCMPDALIKDLQKQVKEKGENVYDSLYGTLRPVAHPFDDIKTD